MVADPDDDLLQQALCRARERQRSVFVYYDGHAWRVAEKLSDTTPGARIVEVPPDTGLEMETRNQGGC